MMYYLMVEVVDGEIKKVYEVKVLEKVWENFKKLEDFIYFCDVQFYYLISILYFM